MQQQSQSGRGVCGSKCESLEGTADGQGGTGDHCRRRSSMFALMQRTERQREIERATHLKHHARHACDHGHQHRYLHHDVISRCGVPHQPLDSGDVPRIARQRGLQHKHTTTVLSRREQTQPIQQAVSALQGVAVGLLLCATHLGGHDGKLPQELPVSAPRCCSSTALCSRHAIQDQGRQQGVGGSETQRCVKWWACGRCFR